MDRVAARREDRDLLAGSDDLEFALETGRLADPVALHRRHAIGPAARDELVDAVEQPLRVGRDPKRPLGQRLLHDDGFAAPALPLDDLLVRENRVVLRAPVHFLVGAIDQPTLEEFQEEPLVPLVVLGEIRPDLAIPVVGHAQRLELAFHVRDVLRRADSGMHSVLDRRVFRGHSERVPPHRVQHLLPLRPLEARDQIADRVVAHVPHVQVARGIRKHLEHVVLLRGIGPIGRGEGLRIGPHLLPLRLDRLVVVERNRSVGCLGRWNPGEGLQPARVVAGVENLLRATTRIIDQATRFEVTQNVRDRRDRDSFRARAGHRRGILDHGRRRVSFREHHDLDLGPAEGLPVPAPGLTRFPRLDVDRAGVGECAIDDVLHEDPRNLAEARHARGILRRSRARRQFGDGARHRRPFIRRLHQLQRATPMKCLQGGSIENNPRDGRGGS